MLPLLNIHWNPDPELFNLFGISIRYYGLLWVISLAFAYFIVQKEYRDRRIGDDKFEPPCRKNTATGASATTSSNRCSSTASSASLSVPAWATACSTSPTTTCTTSGK